MRTAIETSYLPARDDEAPGVAVRTDTPLIVIPSRVFADYDAANDRTPVAIAERPTSYALHLATRAHRAKDIGDLFATAIRSTAAYFRRVRAGVQERRQARLNEDALRRLDERMLRDLGLPPIELPHTPADSLFDLRNRS